METTVLAYHPKCAELPARRRFPFDILSIILSFSFIDDVINIAKAFGETANDVTKLIRERNGLPSLFRGLLKDPDTLIQYMRKTTCYLVGSRALNFMSPGSCESSSDWNFAIRDVDNVLEMKKVFEDLGVIWQESYDSMRYDLDKAVIFSGIVYNTRGKEQKIQLICTYRNSVVDMLLFSHSSPIQCMVAHFGIIHMQWFLTKNKSSLMWKDRLMDDEKDVISFNRNKCRHHKGLRTLNAMLDNHTINIVDSTTLDTVLSNCKREYDSYIASNGLACIDFVRMLDDNKHYDLIRTIIGILDSSVKQSIPRGIQNTIVASVLIYISLECTCINQLRLRDSASKYISRGYKHMYFDNYLCITSGWFYEYGSSYAVDESTYRMRNLADNDSLVLSVYSGKREDQFYNKDCIDWAKKYTWAEHKGSTVPICEIGRLMGRSATRATVGMF